MLVILQRPGTSRRSLNGFSFVTPTVADKGVMMQDRSRVRFQFQWHIALALSSGCASVSPGRKWMRSRRTNSAASCPMVAGPYDAVRSNLMLGLFAHISD